MQNSKETKIWNATLYLRLSRDDGDKEESNSITGQRELLRDFIRTRPELREYAVRIDDGFTGSNFERPSFKKMLEDVKAGRTNCIIVKDLSRFGRNYLDAGEYIEKIFPFLGVRFIAVNDNYDSFGGKNASDELIIPFKNLINEAYCRDISVKVRTQLEVKRKSGQYIGAFAVYGYLKDDADKNHLIVDEYAADIVRDIFSWKLEGMSPQDIAARLNRNGVLSPMEYKKSLGMKFATSFKANPQALWSANAVLRILKNPVYTGVLIQGRETTPSYKVRKRVTKPETNGQSFRTPTKPLSSTGTLTVCRRRSYWIPAAAPATAPCGFSAAWCSAASAAQAWYARPSPPGRRNTPTTSAPRTSRINPVRPIGCVTRRLQILCWKRSGSISGM